MRKKQDEAKEKYDEEEIRSSGAKQKITGQNNNGVGNKTDNVRAAGPYKIWYGISSHILRSSTITSMPLS